jgi:hypothetical protein
MKATLEYELPEEKRDMEYALKGVDAMILIDNLLNEIRSALRHQSGEFRELDEPTLEKIREWVVQESEYRQLPELY